jgi:alpha-galactosidase
MKSESVRSIVDRLAAQKEWLPIAPSIEAAAMNLCLAKPADRGGDGMGTKDPILLSRRRLLQNGALLVASGGLGVTPALGMAAPQSGSAGTEGTGGSWTLGNELVRRVVTFKPGTGLYTEQLSSLATNKDLISSGNIQIRLEEEFSFLCNGKRCLGASLDFDLLGGAETPLANGKSLAVRLKHRELPLEVTAVYSVYDGHPALRKHLVVRNTGADVLDLTHMNIEAIGVALGAADEITLLTQYGSVPREIFYTGRVEDVCLLVANGLTGDGIAVINEVPGWMKRTEIGGWDDLDHTRIWAMYDTDLMPFERRIEPGEAFTTASASLIPFRTGDGFSDPQWSLPSYAAQVLERRVDAAGPPWIYNTWMPFKRDIDTRLILELIDAAGSMGMDIFTIDDGWQQEYGENTVDPTRFPDGLEPIMAAVESRGMRMGLWIPMAPIATSTQAYREHPEWATLDMEGKPKTTHTVAGPKVVMCMASAYRDTVAPRVIDAIERYRAAYIKLDLTTIFNAYGEAPGCWAKGHYHADWAESLNRIYEGISYATHQIYERHPEVLLDLTFELWGQKHIIDAGLLAAGDLDWMSNIDDTGPGAAGPIQARQLLYQRAVSMPAESMLIGNMQAEEQTIEEQFATAIGSAPLYLGDLRKLSAADRQWYHEKIAWFKQLRKSAKISESFFPLGSWRQTTPAAWDGFARFSRGGRGVIALFRNESGAREAVVQLPLLPEGRYKVYSVISGKDRGVFSKAEWARGVPIAFEPGSKAQVLEVNRQA